MSDIKSRTAYEWMRTNPVLRTGEPGHDRTTGRIKIGDGRKKWSELNYLSDAAGVEFTLPVGGSDGQALLKSGTSVVWGTVSGAGGTSTPEKAVFGWVSPRAPIPLNAASAPTVTVETVAPYANTLPYDTPLVAHPSGRYELLNTGGVDGLVNTANAPVASNTMEAYTEFTTGEAGIAVRYYVGGSATYRVFVEGALAATGSIAFPAGNRYLRLVFPTAARRTIRIETLGGNFAGISYAPGAEITPPPVRKPIAVMYGDSYVGGAGALPYTDLHAYKIAQALSWDISRMGHGGSGYVADAAGTTSQPMTDATRLAALAAQTPDYAIIQGSINDDAVAAATVGAAAASVYSTLATSTPRTKLIVVGVQSVPNAASAARTAINAAIKSAALAAPNVVKFLDPIGEQWLTNADTGLLLDGVHLTADGHTVWANKLVTSLVKS